MIAPMQEAANDAESVHIRYLSWRAPGGRDTPETQVISECSPAGIVPPA
jgi:hypothetical protein